MSINYNKYPPNWKEIRQRILNRAQNKCEFCGLENYSLVLRGDKKVKIILTIAHLDHDETNHNVSDDRLKALCQKCHINYDKEEKIRRRKSKININSKLGIIQN